MCLESVIKTIKARPSKKQTMALVAYLKEGLSFQKEGALGVFDKARSYFMNVDDIDGVHRLDHFLNKVATHQVEIASFEESAAWRSFAISTVLKHSASLVLTKCISYEKIESLIKVFTKKNYPLEIFPLIFPTESLKKYSACDTLQLAFDLKKVQIGQQCELGSAGLEAKNILMGDPNEQELFEGVFFLNVFCTAQEAEDLALILEELPGSPLIADQTLYAKDQDARIHPVKVLICDVGPIWSMGQDSVHTVDVIRAASFLKKTIVQNRLIPSKIEISAAAYYNQLNTLNVKVAVVHNNKFIGGLDLINISYPDIFIAKLDAMLDSMDVAPCIRSANTRRTENIPADNEFYTPSGWRLFD